ncbi:flagellar brake protein [Bordetella sp. FB-8]|uniref:flagellar brake protein n=1 Tax=Bordetella sp. FB-8 TaxID=1159870 RepID=UPI0003775C88|nr:flagellar brake protein [Bordetella sp. FB-8]
MNAPQIQQNRDTEIRGTDPGDPRAAYGILNPLAINRYLMQSVKNGDLFTVNFRGQQFITCLLDIDSREDALIFDSSQVQEENAALIASPRCRLKGQSGGVTVEFDLPGVRATQFEGRSALKSALPSVLFYIQRRQFFRVNTPVIDPFHCSGKMLLSHGGEREYDVEIHDLSLSGIGLRSVDSIDAGTRLPDAYIDLRGAGALETDLCVANCKTIELANRKQVYHVGCIFENLSLQQEIKLQRYIHQVEKELAMLKSAKE